MKNLLKINYLLVTLLFVSITFSSCSKKDDVAPSMDKSKFVGEWTVTGLYLNNQNILEAEANGEGNYVKFDEVKEIFGTPHNGDGRFTAQVKYYYNGMTTDYMFGSWKMQSNSIIRINNEADLKIKKITATELNFEIEDSEMGWVEIRCIKK